MAKKMHEPIHPGEILREDFMKPFSLTAHRLAMELAVSAPRVNDLIREKRGMTGDMALRLARYFGTTPGFWMNLQSRYALDVALRASGNDIIARVKARDAAA
jgi:addiction module HigA family antidote